MKDSKHFTGWIAFGISVGLCTAGQLGMKLAMTALSGNYPLDSVQAVLAVPPLAWLPVMGALAVYGMGTLCWIYCLRYLDLSLAHPVSTIQFPVIFLLSWLVLGERIEPLRWLGLVVIVTGVVLLTADRREHAG